jgi:hypothetical protein
VELASGSDITAIPLGGFSFWERVVAMGWGLEKTLGSTMLLSAVLDRDYRSDEEIADIVTKLRKSLSFAFIHLRKEIENYLLIPNALQRAIEEATREKRSRTGENVQVIESIGALLNEVTAPIRDNALAQYLDNRIRFLRGGKRPTATLTRETIGWFEEKWKHMESRVEIIPGKQCLSSLRTILQERYSLGLTDARIIRAIHPEEIPTDFTDMLQTLDDFRKASATTNSAIS